MNITWRSRVHAFWLLQVGGWSAYAWSKQLAFPVALIDCLWIIAKGIVLTLGLRAVLLRVERAGATTAGLLTAAIALAVICACTSLALSQAASAGGWVLDAQGVGAWLASVEGLLFEFLVYLTWTALYLGIRHGLALRDEQQHLRVALADAQRARAQMLRYQLNPHFLFNALASLHALVREDAERARRVIADLTGFLRYSLLDGAADSTSLAREFEAIRHYLAVQKVRFEERISFAVSMDAAVADVEVPAFLVQPLVENAVKYGMRTTRRGPAIIEVTAQRVGRCCVLEVRNSGRWVGAEDRRGPEFDRSGVGLSNVRNRLAECAGGRWRFAVGPAANGVLARLELDVA